MKVFFAIFLGVFGIYVLIGFIFAIFFVIKGIKVIDQDAAGASWVLRLLLFPASVALWIVLLPKWLNAKKSSL